MKTGSVCMSPVFNGLWGQVKKVSPAPECASVYEGNYYYPFKGESDKIIKSFKYEKICTREVTGYGAFPYVLETIKERMVKAPLSFTEAEYKQYKKDFKEGKQISERSMSIEKELTERGLLAYLNNYPQAVEGHKSFSKIGKIIRNIFK